MGSVGVGTLSPSSSGITMEADILKIRSKSDPSQYCSFYLNYGALYPGTLSYPQIGDYGDDWYAGFFNYGYFNNLSTYNFSNYSDENLKKNINTMSIVSDKLMELKPVSFNYIDSVLVQGKGKTSYQKLPQKSIFGFIAQDVQSVYPNLVTENPKKGYL